jgi:hypothetical protein
MTDVCKHAHTDHPKKIVMLASDKLTVQHAETSRARAAEKILKPPSKSSEEQQEIKGRQCIFISYHSKVCVGSQAKLLCGRRQGEARKGSGIMDFREWEVFEKKWEKPRSLRIRICDGHTIQHLAKICVR